MSEDIPTPTDDLDVRRKRAAYRANYRGTKEMDWLMGKFAEARLSRMDDTELSDFERLLVLPDPDLHTWILDPSIVGDSELAPLIRAIHNFHGLSAKGLA
ncbi:MAG: succinate dehydrogenase assembly factor 2 [Hyphomicrobiaceae bacterium]|nr:succinate dehydrogenase assembly factor 2 [Hyphomicrobiaceae bacterium]